MLKYEAPLAVFCFFILLICSQPALAACIQGGATPDNFKLMVGSGAVFLICFPLTLYFKSVQNRVGWRWAKFLTSGGLAFFMLTFMFWQMGKGITESNRIQNCPVEQTAPKP